MQPADACFHCALPIPENCDYAVEIDGHREPVCCPGCQAVAELISAAGLASYYALRDAPAPGSGRPEADSGEWEVFDRDDMQDAFTAAEGSCRAASVYVAGMYCSACTWLIESTLEKAGGVAEASVNPVTHRVRVRFRPDEIGLGGILATLSNIGYKPQPLAPDADARPEVAEQRSALKRLLVASLGMMQVMMFAVALYAGEFQGIDASMQKFLRLVSFVVATPVVFYSARPFFDNALRGLASGKPGMDLPVSIAVGSAYVASVYATLTNGAAVWYDSVTMFVFFLTLGRFLEMRARHRSVDRAVALSTLLPNTVIRVGDDARERIPVSRVAAGDRLLVAPGESIPADGVIAAGSTHVDEAVLTGESAPQPKTVADRVVAGSINMDGAIEINVEATGIDTALGTIGRLSERARHARPAYVRLADRIAGYVVFATLAIAAAVATGWYFIDASRAFVVTLSVLVVTCPCALALATPAAFAAAASRLAELRLLVTNGNAIEILSRATRAMFDKTGTLTERRPAITRMRVIADDYTADDCRRIAAALESVSTHPLAAAFKTDGPLPNVRDARAHPGLGVTGRIGDTVWHLGRPGFVHAGGAPSRSAATVAWLGDGRRVVAEFEISDALRADAAATIAELRRLGLSLSLVSGDREGPVRDAAGQLGIADARHSLLPEAKLDAIVERQRAGEIVLMVGDGINDAPVLAAADVSMAPAHAARLAQTSADVIVLGDALRPIATAIRMTRSTMRIVRQNLAWAIVYNATALPLAAAGMVPPWLAAIGMSASSLVVVLNALRLSRFK